MNRRGFSKKVFTARKRNNWGNFTLKKFKNYYNKKLVGMSRSEVFKEDNRFYHAVRRRGLNMQILKLNKKSLELNVKE